MTVIVLVLIVSSFILAILAVLGLLRGTAPFLKLKSRGLYAVALLGAFGLFMAGGMLIPRNDVTLSVSPANAVVMVNGERYSGGQRTLNLVANSTYTVEAKAQGYKSKKIEWDTSKQRSLRVELVKKTARDLAAEQAVLEQQKREAAAEAKRQKQAEAAARVAEARKAKELDDGRFVVECERLVKSKLRSPSTAAFANSLVKAAEVRNYKNGNKDWSGWVDSQNGFGATVRAEFLCEYDLDSQKLEVILQPR
jgi:hypothetical protein